MASRVRLSTERRRTAALLVRRVAYGESDWIVHLFTEVDGAVSAIARRARRSSKRFAALEPLHLLRVEYEVCESRELATLTEVKLQLPRIGLTTSLAKMEAAGRALRWVRGTITRNTPEPRLWAETNALLDRLVSCDETQILAKLAGSGLRLLDAAGWGLELRQCVRCAKVCPDNSRVRIDVPAGGVVCRHCGSVGTVASSLQRRCFVEAVDGVDGLIDTAGAKLAIELVTRAFEAHGRGEAT